MKLRTPAAWFAAYLLMSALFLAPLSLRMATHLPDDGDAPQNLWIVWWSATHWQLGFPEILQANGYFPHQQSLLFSEPQFAEALLATPLFALVHNHLLVYNLLILLSLALSALACHYWLAELVGSGRAAALGALVYTFNAHTLSHLPRSQLVTLQWIPFGLFFLHRFFSKRDARYLVPFTVASILQGMASFYYLQFYVVALAVLLPFYLTHYGGWRPRTLGALAASAGACAVPTFIIASPYLARFAQYGFSAEPESMDLLDFLVPVADSPIYAVFTPEPRFVAQFLGYFTLAVGGYGLWCVWTRRASLSTGLATGYLCLGLVALLLAGGPEPTVGKMSLGPGLFQLFQSVGGSVRDPGRFSVILRLALAVFVAIGAARFPASAPAPAPAPRRNAWTVAIASLFLLEQWSPSRTAGVAIPTPAAYRWSADETETGALVDLPVRPFGQIRLNALDAYFSTYHRRPYLFGKPSVYPPAQELLRNALFDFPAPPALDLLASIGVRYAVIHPERWSSEQRPRRLDALRRAERSGKLVLLRELDPTDDSTALAYGMGSERIYRIDAGNAASAPRDCACREIGRESFKVDANGENDPMLAIDGDPDTSWTTGLFLRQGSYFEIDFGEPRRPARIEMELRYPFVELPRGLEVNGFRGERFFRFRKLEGLRETVSLVFELVQDPTGARLRYDLEPMEVERIRLFIDAPPSAVPGWSIPEIHVFENAVP